MGALSLNGQEHTPLYEYAIEESQLLNEALGELCEHLEIMLAFPADLIAGEVIPPQSISYNSSTELLEGLLSPFNLEIKKVSDSKFLIRDRLNDSDLTMGTFEGMAINQKTQMPIAYAAVYFNDFSEGTLTDEEGRFAIKCNSRTADSLIISFVSHRPVAIALEDFKYNQAYALVPQDNVIEDVLVEYIVPPILMNDFENAMIFSQNVPLSQTVFNNDLLRQIQLLPGVAAYNDDSAQLKIRGSNADQSRIIIDGMPLYRVDHYYGVFGAINTAFADKVSLYKNAQPLEFNSLGGGLLVVESANNITESEGEVHVNLLESGAHFKLPLGEKISFDLAGRTTYRNVDDGGLINLKRNRSDENFQDESFVNFIENEPRFRFYDLNASLVIKPSAKSEIALNTFFSNDKFINAFDRTFGGQNNSQTETIYSNEEKWTNNAASLIWKQQFGDKLYFNLTQHHSEYTFSSRLDSELTRKENGQIERKALSIQNDSEIKDL
ncbi:MAG: TonB-dependent receptor plug domain-containing protein, partial [Saprospiraceae bacterium]|nr:TonB-dependent receptor plug domain-containing protein [Saprospiraceae bacterium]